MLDLYSMSGSKFNLSELSRICRRILKGDSTKSDFDTFNNWYHSFDDQKVELDSEADRSALQDRIKNRIDQELAADSGSPRFSMGTIFKLAACLAIIASSVYLYTSLSSNEEGAVHESVIAKRTGPGQRMMVLLPDSSLITLNSNSEIRYSSKFNQETRIVRLTGEGYFSVRKSRNAPEFTVKTGKLNTRVLGTEFNIKAVDLEEMVTVTVISGSVQVDTVATTEFLASNNNAIILSPEEQISYNKESGSIEPGHADTQLTTNWVHGILKFTDASETEVFKQLGNWYGVNFSIEGTSKEQWHLDGRYENKSLEFVLESIGYTMGFTFDILPDSKVRIKYSN